jgi:hypothetical protein
LCELRRGLQRIAITASERAATAVANQVAHTRLRAIQGERRIREADVLEDRLDEPKVRWSRPREEPMAPGG